MRPSTAARGISRSLIECSSRARMPPPCFGSNRRKCWRSPRNRTPRPGTDSPIADRHRALTALALRDKERWLTRPPGAGPPVPDLVHRGVLVSHRQRARHDYRGGVRWLAVAATLGLTISCPTWLGRADASEGSRVTATAACRLVVEYANSVEAAGNRFAYFTVH